jgi:hypothetical protein
MVDCVVVPAASAKSVKDVLKLRGWLDQKRLPGSLSDSRIAFALNPGTEDAVRKAVLAQEPPAFAAISVERRELTVKKTPAPQKPAQSKAAPPRRAPKPQERSFGGGGGSCASSESASLPPAEPVRRVQCPADVDARWLQDHVFQRREPAVLCGLPLGPCVGGWSAEQLAAAECAAPAVSVHVCAAATVDLAGHRAPNTARNFVFKSMPFGEAVRRCAAASADSDGDGDAAAAAGDGDSDGDGALRPLVAAGERYYLRSVGLDPRKCASPRQSSPATVVSKL